MATIAPQRSYTCEQRSLDALEPPAAHQVSFPRCPSLRAATRRRGSQSCSALLLVHRRAQEFRPVVRREFRRMRLTSRSSLSQTGTVRISSTSADAANANRSSTCAPPAEIQRLHSSDGDTDLGFVLRTQPEWIVAGPPPQPPPPPSPLRDRCRPSIATSGFAGAVTPAKTGMSPIRTGARRASGIFTSSPPAIRPVCTVVRHTSRRG